ncbi:alpha-ketoacid dehydrogenase kinase [Martensiomyces pterosporus]|nr:alpha-ketoacid dehydrogenase kinase [Martensiomyces pterosporus]
MARRTPNNSTAARSDILTRHSAMILHSSGAQTDPSVQSHSEPSFYSEDVDRYAATDLQPVTLGSLLRICEPPLTRESLLENSQFLCSERPVRYAKRVKLFQRLPYIVGLNPHLNEVYQIYYRHFEESRKFPMVESLGDQRKFIQMLARQSDTLKDVMPKIARGFYESRRYFSTEDRCQFLDHLVKMRIGLRLLTSQHIALYHQYQATVNGTYDEETDTGRYQGIIDNQLKLAHMVRVCAQGVQAMCDMAYGEAPNFTIDGQANVTFRYIPSHLEYMLVELLKNAFRSTLQNAKDREEIPPVKITISKGNGRVAIRIRDFGGGIPSEIQDSVFDYSFTTVKHRSVDGDEDQGEATTEALHSAQPGQSPIAGLGFGLPMTKLYAEYFGGSLNLISLEGYGCDVFLELPSIKVSRSPKIQI